MQEDSITQQSGPIAWMATHSIAATLLMIVCLLGGLLFIGAIKQEVFPEFQVESVKISIAYPGASPEEIESGLLLAIEDAISGIDGIDEINAKASEGLGTVIVDAMGGTDIQRLAQDIEREVNRITTFPIDAEEPKVAAVSRHREVLVLVLYGDAKNHVLHELAEQLRNRLLQDPAITQVELEGVNPLEISINVSQENLRRYQLSLSEIALRIQNASVDLPGGSVKTIAGEILIRMKERKDFGRQFANIPIITASNGSIVRLGDIASIEDGYEHSDYSATYNGLSAVMVQVYSVGIQTPIEVSEAVKKHLDRVREELPQGINAEVRYDASDMYAQRIDLLVDDSIAGLVLVFFALALFLELRLAFWVMMGIPTAFLGSFLLLPSLDVSLNMVSLFAFLISGGIVVDDAIIIGENIYHHRQQGLPPMQAAIQGTREMAVPVSFSILVNMAAFVPIFYIPGETGKIFYMLPMVILTVFLVSLVESLFILPHHLGRLNLATPTGVRLWIYQHQQDFSNSFQRWVNTLYAPFLALLLKHRYLTLIAALAILITTLSYAFSGRMGMSMFPKVDSDFARVTVTLPYGTSVEKTKAIVEKIVASARETVKHINNGDQLIRGIFAEIGKGGSHKAIIRAYLAPPELREKIISTEQFSQRWRQATGDIIGVESILFESDAGGPGAGSAITIELNHQDIKVLEKVGQELADALRAYPIVKDVDDGFSLGKQQLDFTVLPEGKSLGLTAQQVARQVRNAFYGAEVLRQQRGRNEIKIMVRLPEDERLSESDIEKLMIWTKTGKEVPLNEAVHVERGRAYTEINRHNGHRDVQVKANVIPKSKAGEILNDLEVTELKRLMAQYPGLQYSFQGQAADMSESMDSLTISFIFALLAIYILLAIPLQSYVLPLIVISSIPFGVIGAIFGHLLMGYDLSLISVLGIVSLAGIVANDSLILIDQALQLKKNHDIPAIEIIKTAAVQRFRPIILTTFTTFFGLMPMILETSRQARMLIPMAISIGFGILFATMITLILIPSLYVVVDDVRNLLKKNKREV
ncbi:efflux RND transporter permease subunit [Methyloglobulus sp.]|uniref:efflux RND transporter permease subunit n=1 Tax=Methyloglobulus sp. TaxID=2518622 RepID=UPI003989C3E2